MNTTRELTPHEAAMLKVVRHLACSDEMLQKAMNWMAAPLQSGMYIKLAQAMVLAGDIRNGRSVLQQSLADLYHEAAYSIGTVTLEACAHHIPQRVRLLTVFDDSQWKPEMSFQALFKNELKQLVSNKVRIVGKEIQRTTANHLNIVFTTGYRDPLNSQCDRRFFILQTEEPLALTREEDFLLSNCNRLERALALRNLLRQHQISQEAL